jgi:hypothetical protein
MEGNDGVIFDSTGIILRELGEGFVYRLVSGCCTRAGQALVLNFDRFITLYMIKNK